MKWSTALNLPNNVKGNFSKNDATLSTIFIKKY